MSAEIVPFPVHRAEAAPAETGAERLARALLALDAALAAQRDSIAAWRASLAELKTTVAGLGQGLRQYGGSLETLHTGVVRVNAEAQRLQSWAESAERR
jgi:hypothetical protein